MGMPKYMSPLAKQTWTVAGVLLAILSQGMAQGFMSVLLTALKKPESPIKIDLHLASWLASSMAMSVVIGALTASILMDLFGRKIAFILEVLPGIISMLLMYSATDFSTLVAARLLDGITSGGTVIIGAVVIGEYTSPSYRGMFLNLKTACICLGTTLVHGLGYHLHWKTVALLSLIPYSIALLIMFTWKESPSWLASKRKFGEAEKSFIWLRGNSNKTRLELDELIKNQEERTAPSRTTILVNIKMFFKKFVRRDFLKPVLIGCVTSILLEMSGRHIVPAYVADIIGGIVGNHEKSFYYTLSIDLIVTISSTCSSILIKLVRMRTLLFSSGIAALVVLFNACLYLFLVSREVISNDMPWIPITMFIVYFIVINLGCTPIPLALIGEIYPLEHKSSGIFTSMAFACIIIVITLKIFPYLLLHVKIYGTFALLGLVIAIVLIGLYFILPETRGKTLQEIEDSMMGKEKSERRDKECSEKMLD